MPMQFNLTNKMGVFGDDDGQAFVRSCVRRGVSESDALDMIIAGVSIVVEATVYELI